MKKFLIPAAALVALVGAAPALAQHNSYPGEYSGPNGSGHILWAGYAPGGIPDDTTPALQTVTNTFTLTGSVAKDCSFSGGTGTSHSIPLGAIGVKNGNTELSSDLFNQNGDFTYQIGASSAGCNFNNTVTVSKSAQGLVNSGARGYDSNNFTANIPYSLRLGIAEATTNTAAGAPGQWTPMTVAANAASNSEHLGAWRSKVDLLATIPAQSLGLVAGAYSDTITVTLAVDTAA